MASFGVLGAFVFALTRALGSVVVTTSARGVPFQHGANSGLVAGAGGYDTKKPHPMGTGFRLLLISFFHTIKGVF